MHNGRQHPPIPQDGGERADHHHQRQDGEGQIDHIGGMGDGERRRTAADITENEAGAGAGGVGQRAHQSIEPEQQVLDHGHLEQQQCQRRLQQQGARHHTPAERFAILGQGPGSRNQHADSQQRLRLRQCQPPQNSRHTLHDFHFYKSLEQG
jgi:hypothetical protein